VRRDQRDVYFNFQDTHRESSDHHAIRFMGWRAGLKPVGVRAEHYYKVQVDGQETGDFIVTTVQRGGIAWWYVYRKNNAGAYKWAGRFPNSGEAAGFINDLVAGRERVFFSDNVFVKKPIKPKAD